MCTYNGEKYLQEQLDSIEKNNYTNWELYVFDDGSEDKTLEVLYKFKQNSNHVVNVVCNPISKGPTMNFLSGIQYVSRIMASSDYIMLADQDDIWKKNKISITLKTICNARENNNKPILVCSDVTLVNEKKELIAVSYAKRNHFNITHVDFAHHIMENHVQGCTIMMNCVLSKMIKTLPQYATMHDSWIGMVASAFGEIVYINEQTMYYRRHETAVTGSNVSFIQDLKWKFCNINVQRAIVLNSIPMCREFRIIYENMLTKYTEDILDAYVGFETKKYIKKRFDLIRLHMWKSSLLKNIGLLLLL